MANIFPRWSNLLPIKIAICLVLVVAGLAVAFTYYATPKALRVGYTPSQPIPFSHKIHVDQIGLDCRYCHAFVDKSRTSGVPSGNTCWNCHQHVQRDSPKLAPLHRSMDPSFPGYDGKPIRWVRVHNVPDYVKFDHSAHVNRGISCQSCHGQVNKMEVVTHEKSLSMAFCLDCHRAPENNLRPLEEVFNLNYNDADVTKYTKDPAVKTTLDLGKQLKTDFNIQTKTSCATCHH